VIAHGLITTGTHKNAEDLEKNVEEHERDPEGGKEPIQGQTEESHAGLLRVISTGNP